MRSEEPSFDRRSRGRRTGTQGELVETRSELQQRWLRTLFGDVMKVEFVEPAEHLKVLR
jgi:hypothetical protein